MKIIKFRGKSVQTNEWVIGNYSDMSEIVSTWYFIEYVEDGRRKREMIIPKSAGQFTVLLDKNGKEAYHGDLVIIGAEEFGFITNNKNENVIYEVRHEGCDFILYRHDIKMNWGRLSRLQEMGWFCEIIGNVFDNPELLERGNIK